MKVKIPDHIYDQIFFFVDRSKVEVSMMARVKIEEDNIFRLTKLYLVKQVNHSSETEMDDKELAKLLYDSRGDEGDMNCWIHSHVDMPTFWSGPDKEQIKKLGNQGYILAIVVNKKREHRSCYYQGADGFKPAITIDEIETERVYMRSTALDKQWAEEFDEKCKEATPVYRGKHDMRDWDDWRGYGSTYLPLNKTKEGTPKRMTKKTLLSFCLNIPKKERNLWWKDYIKTYQMTPVTSTDLEDFYFEWMTDAAEEDVVPIGEIEDSVPYQEDEIVITEDNILRDRNGVMYGIQS